MTNSLPSIVLDIRMMSHSGIGVYLRGLLEGMASLPDAPRFIFYGPHRFRPEVPERLCELFVIRDFPIYSLSEQFLFPESLRRHPLFHAPHYNIPLRFRGNLVVTIHDLNHLQFPENLPTFLHRAYARYMFGQVAARAAHIITVSETMRHDVMEHLKVPPDRVTTIPNAVGDRLKRTDDPAVLADFRHKHNLPERYLLAVGIHKPHKNYSFLVRTLAALWDAGRLSLPLVIADPRPEDHTGLAAIALDCKVPEKVLLPGGFQWSDMGHLFTGAEVLIFPSLYEGFGLPPLEAMKMEVPVLSSNRPPMTEVLGDAALFFDPASPEALSDALLRLLSDTTLRSNLVEKGRRNLARFSWKKTAQATLEVYRNALDTEP